MPYVTCRACTVSVYTAAAHTTRDACPVCDEPLALLSRSARSRADARTAPDPVSRLSPARRPTVRPAGRRPATPALAG